MTSWALALMSVFGYVIIGLVLGLVVSNLVYKETKNQTDAYSMGIVSAVLWPLALLVMVVGAIWFMVIKPILTPKAIKEQEKADYEARKQAAIEKGINPKSVPKRYVPQYEDAE